jgi:ribosomal protein S1
MEEIIIETLKGAFKVGGTLLIAVIIVLFLLGQFPNLKLLVSAVLTFFGGAGKWVRRRALETEIEGAVNSFSKSFNRNYSFDLLPECDVQWVTARNQENVLKPGKAIVKLSFSRDDHDLNFYNAAQAFVETGLLPDTRPFLVRATAKAIDLLMVKILILQGRRQALRIFNSKFAEQEPDAQSVYAKLAETDEKGLFRQLLLPELHLFGQAVSQKTPSAEISAETESFVDWFHELATRLAGEVTQLAFESTNIRVGVILVADQETYDKYGIRAYLRRANLYAAREFHCIYVLSRGRRRADIAGTIVDKLCQTGGYSVLSKRTAAVKGIGDDEVLITCIAIKPDITAILSNAWQKLGEDFSAASVVTGTVEYVTEDLVTVDVYGINFELDREHLSSVAMGPVFRFFERDQELELRILQFDEAGQTAELTNCDTATDPKALAELVEQNKGQTAKATVEKIISSRDYEVGLALTTRLGDRSVRAFLPRINATFSRYVSLAERFPIGSEVSVRVEKFDLEHGGLTCSLEGLRDPWDPPPPLQEGSKIKARICEVSENHATCEIEEGIEARLHHLEISWEAAEVNRRYIRDMAVGTLLEGVVLRIEPEKRYISFSVKRLTKSDTEKFFDDHHNDLVDVKIEDIGPIGATVSFPGTLISGRLHVSDIIWGYCERITDYVQEGDTTSVRCLAYDQWADVIHVGIKQVEPNHFGEFQLHHEVGSSVTCRVDAVSGRSIRVRALFDGQQAFGYVYRTEISWLLFVDDRMARHIFRPGEVYQCCVKRYDAANQVVEFSRKQFLALQHEKNAYGTPYPLAWFFRNGRLSPTAICLKARSSTALMTAVIDRPTLR